jgi:trimethylamine:corrinoid methyltransferase-like protein
LEVNEALYKFYAGMEVSEETICLDLISEMEFCSQRTYLETEHTAHHFRQVGWLPKLFDRSYCDHESLAVVSDEALLERADHAWRELVARQRPPDIGPHFARELDRITAAARRELLEA